MQKWPNTTWNHLNCVIRTTINKDQKNENIKKLIERKNDKGNKTHKDDWMGEILRFYL